MDLGNNINQDSSFECLLLCVVIMIIVYDNYAFARFTAPDHVTIDYSFELCFLSALMSGPPGKMIQRMVLLMIIEA